MVDGRGWLDGELRKIGAGLDRMKLGTRHALREGACLVFFWCWGGWLRGQIGKVAARTPGECVCPVFLFRFRNARNPKDSAYTLSQPDGAAVNSPSAKNCLRACAPCLCGRMLRVSNIPAQSQENRTDTFSRLSSRTLPAECDRRRAGGVW